MAADYLNQYGEMGTAAENRFKKIKLAIAALVGLLLLGIIGYLFFKNFREKQVVKEFLSEVNSKQYQQAYQTWGCKQPGGCRDYSYQRFMEDWGPSKQARTDWRMEEVDSCGSGVIVRVGATNTEPASIWVDRATRVLGFSPWNECPGKKWRFGQFFRSVLGG